MSRSYEPDADRQLDEGSEPIELCIDCSDELLPFEGSVCSNCLEAKAAQEQLPDDEDEAAWVERELRRYDG